ncbi:expressed unknown protein [Seminavis robusta]|uniref:CP12 domain-containing protein n=1 Tax=Seminavis robusta TaxID=568900 RepID=A0A9N8DRP0_9STRA|nr:expressed unknown protein [Seminavis robusta]|eukprot:Sro292_g109690.1 n/a (225) ;mRNA; f:61448-62293
MKLSLSLAFLAATAVHGFAPSTVGFRATTSLKSVDRPDASAAIEAAMAATKEFGATSTEARMAWETVEEMDAADTSAATGGSLDECETEGDASDACKEYGEKLDALADLMKTQGKFVEQMKGLTDELQKIKVSSAPAPKAQDSPELRAAVKAAKAASEEFGASSPEAAVAWDTVEEIAAAGNSNALGGSLTDECLVEAMEACEALDELNRVLSLNAGDGSRYSG